MNLDIRVKLGLFENIKIIRLEGRHGDHGIVCLLRLWLWIAGNKSSGVLGDITPEELEIVAKWRGENGAFIKSLLEIGLLDETDGGYIVHDWEENNPYAADSNNRSDAARLASFCKYNPEEGKKLKAQGVKRLTQSEFSELKNKENMRTQCERNANAKRNACETVCPINQIPYTINQDIKDNISPQNEEEKDTAFSFEQFADMWNDFAAENKMERITKRTGNRPKRFKARQKAFAKLTPSGYTKEFWQAVLEGVKIQGGGWWIGKLKIDRLLRDDEIIDSFINAVPPEQDSGGTWERIQDNGAENINLCEAAQNTQTTG